MRISPEKAAQVIQLLCEGTGIRVCERLTGLNRRTVLAILEVAGQKCIRLLGTRLRNLTVHDVQLDEVFSFVGCLQQNTVPEDRFRGDQYAFLAVERDTKLILHWFLGKRTSASTAEFLAGLQPKISSRFQVTTDGFQPYKFHIPATFGDSVDYGTEVKIFGPLYEGIPERRLNPVVCKGVTRKAIYGNPDRKRICTNHVERTNLSVRLFNRRFTRKTMGFSKKWQNHCYALALQIAHFNFCRVHSAHNQTPAQAAGLAGIAWTARELLENLKRY